MEFTIVLHEAEEGGFWVEVPALPGCFSQGESVDEAFRNARKAIRSHLDALREDHQPMPKESGFLLGRVKVAI